MKNTDIIARYDANVSQRQTINQTWQMINDYVMPFRSEFFKNQGSEHEVEWRDNRKVFDSTAIMANQTLAASLHGSLTSPSIMWFSIKFREEELNQDNEAKKWLEDASKAVYQALQDSNFNLEINETYVDLAGYGSSVITEEYEVVNNKVELSFQSVPIEECYFEEDHKSEVNTLYRHLRWTSVQLVSKFGKEGVPKAIFDESEDAAGIDTRHDVVFCIYKRANKEDKEGVLAPKERPVGFKYILHSSAELLGDEGGYYEMPSFVPRWRKASGSKWGYSQAMLALPDILTLNEVVEMTLVAAGKAIDPAMKVTERGLLSDVDVDRGGLTVVRTMEDMQPFEGGARFDVSELQKSALIESIRSIFHVDQLELKQSPNMTATEVQVRYEMMQRLLGPTLGRLQTDLLNPIINRTFRILLREGQLAELPAALAEQGGTTEIDYVGALSRAQKADMNTSVERWVGNIANLSQIEPEVLDNVDFDGIARGTAANGAIPASMQRGKAEVEALRKQRKEQQAKEQEVMMQQAQGDAMKAQGDGQAALEQGATNA